MDTMYTALADAVFGLHLLFALAILPSTALLCLGAYRNRPVLRTAQCLGISVMAVGQAVLLECPLVVLERTLRESASTSPWYHGSFIVFVFQRATGVQLPAGVVVSLSVLVISLSAAALLAQARHAFGRRRLQLATGN